MSEKRERPLVIDVLTLATIMMTASIKNDLPLFGISELWSEMTFDPVVSYLKRHDYLFVLAALFCGVISVSRVKSVAIIVPRFNIIAIFLMSVYATMRFALADNSDYAKLGIVPVTIFAISIYLLVFAREYRPTMTEKLISQSLMFFAVFLVVLNFYNYLTGNGFVPGLSRLFGTASHPNHLAAQLALVDTVLLVWAIEARGTGRLFFIAVTGAGLYMLYLTGSRTGLLMMIVGVFATFWARSKFSFIIIASAAILVLLFLFMTQGIVLYNNDFLEVYNRGEISDTRSEVWANLWGSIRDRPVLGYGSLTAPSENSYLRAWFAYGFLYFAAELVIIISVIRSYVLSIIRVGGWTLSMLFGLVIAELGGAIFEGYLADAFSVPLIIWIALCAISQIRVCADTDHGGRKNT